MQIANSQKRGAALGAVFALLLSTLGFASPAQAIDAATNGEHIAITPVLGAVDNFNGLNTEDFAIMAYLPVSSHSNFVSDKVYWEITKTPATMDVLITESAAISGAVPPEGITTGATGSSYSAVMTQSSSVVSFQADVASGKSTLYLAAYTSSGVTSVSPAVTLTVKYWIENTATLNGVHDTYEWFTTKTVTLKSIQDVTSAVTFTAPKAGDTTITVSATVGGINFENVGGKFFLAMTSSAATTFDSGDNDESSDLGTILTANQVASRSGVVSQSFTVANGSGLTESVSISAHVRFSSASSPVYASGYQLGATTSAVVSGAGVTALTNTVLVTDHSTYSGQAATVRTNETYTFVVGAKTNSTSVSDKVVSVAFLSGPALTANSKYISINGAAATTSWPSAASPLLVTTGTNGLGSFTVKTTGFVDNDDFTVYAFVGNISKSLTVAVEPASYSVAAEYTTYASGAGETTNIVYSVTDQFGTLSSKPNQQLRVTRGGTGFNYSSTLSYHAVVGGKATVAFVPQAATATGSATVDAKLEELDYNNGSYVAAGADAGQVSINVSATSNAFGTGLAASFSMSVSYHPSTVSWTTVTGKVTNTGSEIVVTGPASGLVYKNAAGETFSQGITVRAGSGPSYTFYVSALLAGSHTITLTNGSDVTTSLLVVDAVSGSVDSAQISFDTENIVPGRTKIVTGTVTDANGNPVNTSGVTGSVAIAYSGTAGIPVGSFPTETDASGQFKVSILTSATDNGEFTLTASYLKDDSSTAAYDKVVKAQTITVGASSVDSSDQKITVGTFKGYVAIYTKGYMGQKLSAKVAGKWLVVDPIAAYKSNDYSRTVRLTGAGYTITVDLYIDGAFVRSEVVTTK